MKLQKFFTQSKKPQIIKKANKIKSLFAFFGFTFTFAFTFIALITIFTPSTTFASNINSLEKRIDRLENILKNKFNIEQINELDNLQKDSFLGNIRSRFSHEEKKNSEQLDFFSNNVLPHPVVDKLKNTDINKLTPLQALERLAAFKKEAEKEQ